MIASNHTMAGSGGYDRHASRWHSFGGHLACVAFCNFTDAGNLQPLGQCQRPGSIMGRDCWTLSPLPWLSPLWYTPLYILIDATGPKLYGLMLDGVPDAGRMFGER